MATRGGANLCVCMESFKNLLVKSYNLKIIWHTCSFGVSLPRLFKYIWLKKWLQECGASFSYVHTGKTLRNLGYIPIQKDKSSHPLIMYASTAPDKNRSFRLFITSRPDLIQDFEDYLMNLFSS